MKYFSLLAPCIFLICCFHAKEGPVHELNKDHLITLFRIEQPTRQELAHVLKTIDSSGPKVIVLNGVLGQLKNHKEDSTLAASISSVKNIIFAADINPYNESIEKSNAFFKRGDFQEGVVSYLVDTNGNTSNYIPLYEDEDEQLFALPDQVVFNFRPETIDRFHKMKINAPVPIKFSKSLSDFNVVDVEHFDPEILKDKIVIIGYLGPTDNDTYQVYYNGSTVKTYSSVITANIILNILSENKVNVVGDN